MKDDLELRALRASYPTSGWTTDARAMALAVATLAACALPLFFTAPASRPTCNATSV